MRKLIFWHVHIRTISISIFTRIGTIWIAKDAKFLLVDKDDSDQPVRMRWLIWAFFGRMCHKVRFLPFGSHDAQYGKKPLMP